MIGVQNLFHKRFCERIAMYYTYMIRCEGGSLYTGIAKNMFTRMAEHNSQKGKCAKYTKSRKVIALEGLWTSRDRSSACRLEAALKTLNKKEKELLLQKPFLLSALLPAMEKEDYVHHPKACLALYLKEIRLPDLP